MGYEINIAKDGVHYFATHERSIGYDKKKLDELYKKFLTIFPESEGYEISISDVQKISTPVSNPNV